MKNKRWMMMLALAIPVLASAQERYMTRTGHVSFFSETTMENIDAHNYKATSVYDATTGSMEYAVLMTAFEFKKALMQEHFNENYVESKKFPKATFKGKVNGLPADALTKPGSYPVTVEGSLTCHGVTKQITTPGEFTIDPTGKISAKSAFSIMLPDYDIKVPGAVRANIEDQIDVKVQVEYQKM